MAADPKTNDTFTPDILAKAQRLSRIKMWYRRITTNSAASDFANDIGFLLDCLNEAEKAAAGLRQTATKLRNSRDVMVTELENQLVIALGAGADLELIELHNADGSLRAKLQVAPDLADKLLTALENTMQGLNITTKPKLPS